MTNIIDNYGIKEVADVVFYELNDNDEFISPVLYLDTLKVSTIEQTSEENKYYGGKGNSLISSWQSKKELTLTLQDALFSMKSLALFLGGEITEEEQIIKKTDEFIATNSILPDKSIGSGWDSVYKDISGNTYSKKNPKFFNDFGKEVKELEVGKKFFCTYDIEFLSTTINIDSSFAEKKYCILGETYIRSELTGKDEPFYFIIPKAKITSNINLTLENEEPSVFDVKINVLKSSKYPLMKLVKQSESDPKGSSILDVARLDELILQ